MSNGNVMKNTEMLQKYLAKYNAWSNDDSKVADFREAQAYYSQAIDAMNDFNRIEQEDKTAKSAVLFTGAFIAMKAVDGFERIIARYKDEFYKKPENKGKEFIVPDIDQDKFASCANLAKTIRDLTPSMDLWLKKFTNAAEYYDTGKTQVDYSRAYYDVPVTENGLKIYHLKTLIDYCEDMLKAINILASDNLSETLNNTNVNFFFKRGSGKHTGLNMFYDEHCTGNPDDIDKKDLIQLCTRIKNMFNDYFAAMALLVQPNQSIEDLDINDRLSIIMKQPKLKSVQMMIDFEDNLTQIIKIATTKNPEDLPSPTKTVSWTVRALEIANAFKMDISEEICKSM